MIKRVNKIKVNVKMNIKNIKKQTNTKQEK